MIKHWTKDEALAVLRALVGGRIPKHGDTIKFEAQGGDNNLGFIYAPALTTDQVQEEIEINWADILGIPATFPPSAHIHPEVLCIETHGADASRARPVGYNVVGWVGMVDPLNSVDGDYWVEVNFL